MFVEAAELYRMLTGGGFYWLPLHLLLFVVLACLVKAAAAARYRPWRGDPGNLKVSVVVPVYREDLHVLKRTLASIAAERPHELIVVHDDGEEHVRRLAARYGARVISFPRRVGKRAAMVAGWRAATGDVVVHVDSDTALRRGALAEILRPFADPRVVAVQGRVYMYRTGGWLPWRMGRVIEYSRDLVNRGLDDHLIVVDGRFNAWRRSWLLSHAEEFLSDRFLGVPVEIGDDRFLTWRANLDGLKTAYQRTAEADSAAQPTLTKFVKQQIRWLRSGYMMFMRDAASGLWRRVGPLYVLYSVVYYLSPISLTFALAHDAVMAQPMLTAPLWAVPILAAAGSSLVAILRKAITGLRGVTLGELLAMGAFGIFLLYPATLYALATIRKQNTWGTRL